MNKIFVKEVIAYPNLDICTIKENFIIDIEIHWSKPTFADDFGPILTYSKIFGQYIKIIMLGLNVILKL